MSKNNKKKKTTSGRKQSISNQEKEYLKKFAENSVIAVFANRKPLKPQ